MTSNSPSREDVTERELKVAGGLVTLSKLLLGFFGSIALIVVCAINGLEPLILLLVPTMLASLFCCIGLFAVQPNSTRVITLFGNYRGSVRTTGLHWANPFARKKAVSLRVRNFESEKLKVNDKDGNPVEIAAVVVWKVIDGAQALFQVDDYQNFVHVQAESAVRNLATHYSYDPHEDGAIALRSHPNEVAAKLKEEIDARVGRAGVDIVEARITHLAYAPEIAHAMLQRQQASAIIAARQKIVDGAVGMVEMALDHLQRRKIVELDGERRAAMVSNLLVVLCSNSGTSPVVNVGSLYT
jgi:regulator of protease activity HflC (stomatin/prohibitin superfamily)